MRHGSREKKILQRTDQKGLFETNLSKLRVSRLNPEKAFAAKHVSFARAGNDTDLVFKDYAKAGDSMTLDFNSAAHKIAAVHVSTWVDSRQQPLKLTVDFSSLPDGTNHPWRTTLDLPAKGLHVVNVNSNYRKAG